MARLGFIYLAASDALREWADKKAKRMPKLKNSITDGKGVKGGFVGQGLAYKFMKCSSPDSNSYDFDLPHPTLGKLEVKTTMCSTTPQSNYLCHVALYNATQNCDAYVFMRVLYDYSGGWFMGWLPAAEFKHKAFKMVKGEQDVDDPEYTASCDCLNIRAYELRGWTTQGELDLPADYFSTMPLTTKKPVITTNP